MNMEHYYHTIGEDWFDYQDLYLEFAQQATNDSLIVELGSWKGRSISFMGVELVNANKAPKIYCVDTWKGTPQLARWAVIENNLYDTFLQNIQPIQSLITPIPLPSLEAVKRFDDGSIDFFFLDASHEYEDVLADLKAWYPKVKPGGVFAGHDYLDPDWPGVERALKEYPPMWNAQRRSSYCFYKVKEMG